MVRYVRGAGDLLVWWLVRRFVFLQHVQNLLGGVRLLLLFLVRFLFLILRLSLRSAVAMAQQLVEDADG